MMIWLERCAFHLNMFLAKLELRNVLWLLESSPTRSPT